ncbi:MAG: phosphoenolpyruvate carboxykinase (GTP) [Clostridia bacterium]
MIFNDVDRKKIEALKNPQVQAYLDEAIALCKPAKVTVLTDSAEDIAYVRSLAIKNGEETKLDMKGHTYHYDGINDQARDKGNTRYLLSKKLDWGMPVNAMDHDEGTKEVREIMKGIMEGKEMVVSFFCLGPTSSKFSIRAMQITDSAYVTHSEQILYRAGYEEFKRNSNDNKFFFFLHSAGELKDGKTVNTDKRRIYIDLDENRVYTVNNQYAGNSVGLKKLAFRLAIQKANNEDWLAEHMFLMGTHGKPGRTTYFTGAFPSGCGKTSTAMIPGQTIVGDDIAYLRNVAGELRGVNVESGIFGIIQDVNGKDDPLIFGALNTPREIIFSNILVNDGIPYWKGMGIDVPNEGINYSGDWKEGKKDAKGNEIPYSSKNARYTIRVNELDNADSTINDPEGVKVSGIIYGGRDSDTTIPCVESLSWAHGVFIGATIESETTSATIGQEGVRVHNPMANLDFVSVPLPQYIQDHLKFGKSFDKAPTVYGTNYFLKNEQGQYTNSKLDKKVWVLWADGRVNNEYKAISTPVGLIPRYEDLKKLFADNLDHDYTEKEYNEQFSLRVDKYLAKMDRMAKIFSKIALPKEFTAELDAQIARLNDAKAKYGAIVLPSVFA